MAEPHGTDCVSPEFHRRAVWAILEERPGDQDRIPRTNERSQRRREVLPSEALALVRTCASLVALDDKGGETRVADRAHELPEVQSFGGKSPVGRHAGTMGDAGHFGCCWHDVPVVER